MDNTSNNKGRFFSQYWGQEIMRFKFWENSQQSRIIDPPLAEGSTYIELKSLSSITDEDAVVLADIMGYPNDERCIEAWGRDRITHAKKRADIFWDDAFTNGIKLWQALDYLRSKSYALPYMGLPVETQIEYGWVKLTCK